MIENIVTCDRCKKKCEGTTYYTVDIYGNDIKPVAGGISFKSASQNAQTNTHKLFDSERHYCEVCKDKIESFLMVDDSKTLYIEPIVVPKEEKHSLMQKVFESLGVKPALLKPCGEEARQND